MKYAIGCFLLGLLNIPGMFFLDVRLSLRFFAAAALLLCWAIGFKILLMQKKHRKTMEEIRQQNKILWQKISSQN